MKHGLIVAMGASAQNASAGLKNFDRGTSPGKSMPRKVVIRESYRRVSAINSIVRSKSSQRPPDKGHRGVIAEVVYFSDWCKKKPSSRSKVVRLSTPLAKPSHPMGKSAMANRLTLQAQAEIRSPGFTPSSTGKSSSELGKGRVLPPGQNAASGQAPGI